LGRGDARHARAGARGPGLSARARLLRRRRHDGLHARVRAVVRPPRHGPSERCGLPRPPRSAACLPEGARGMIVIAGSVRVRPEARERAVQTALDMAAAAPKETGCRAYRFAVDLKDQTLFYLHAEW